MKIKILYFFTESDNFLRSGVEFDVPMDSTVVVCVVVVVSVTL